MNRKESIPRGADCEQSPFVRQYIILSNKWGLFSCGEGLFGGLNCEGEAILVLAFCGEMCYIIGRESAWAEGHTGAERWAAPVFDDDFASARKLRGQWRAQKSRMEKFQALQCGS